MNDNDNGDTGGAKPETIFGLTIEEWQRLWEQPDKLALRDQWLAAIRDGATGIANDSRALFIERHGFAPEERGSVLTWRAASEAVMALTLIVPGPPGAFGKAIGADAMRDLVDAMLHTFYGECDPMVESGAA